MFHNLNGVCRSCPPFLWVNTLKSCNVWLRFVLSYLKSGTNVSFLPRTIPKNPNWLTFRNSVPFQSWIIMQFTFITKMHAFRFSFHKAEIVFLKPMWWSYLCIPAVSFQWCGYSGIANLQENYTLGKFFFSIIYFNTEQSD